MKKIALAWLLGIGLLFSGASLVQTASAQPAPAGVPEHAPGENVAGEAAGHPSVNWFSYERNSEGKKTSPPFFFAIVNFAILLWLLGRYAGPGIKTYLSERHNKIRTDL